MTEEINAHEMKATEREKIETILCSERMNRKRNHNEEK